MGAAEIAFHFHPWRFSGVVEHANDAAILLSRKKSLRLVAHSGAAQCRRRNRLRRLRRRHWTAQANRPRLKADRRVSSNRPGSFRRSLRSGDAAACRGRGRVSDRRRGAAQCCQRNRLRRLRRGPGPAQAHRPPLKARNRMSSDRPGSFRRSLRHGSAAACQCRGRASDRRGQTCRRIN